MRRIAATVLTALLLGVVPAGVAVSQEAQPAQQPAATTTVQAQDDNEDDSNDGLWGLFGLLGLAGLIPWRKNRDRNQHRDTPQTGGRSTGM